MTLTPSLAGAGLEALNARVKHDLACLNLPPANWVPPLEREDGRHVYDVVIVGGGAVRFSGGFRATVGRHLQYPYF